MRIPSLVQSWKTSEWKHDSPPTFLVEAWCDALRSRNRWRLLFVMSMLGHIGWGIGAV